MIEKLQEAYRLVATFQSFNQQRDTEIMLSGRMPDMVDSLIGMAQSDALAYALKLSGVVLTDEQILDAARFEETVSRIRKMEELFR